MGAKIIGKCRDIATEKLNKWFRWFIIQGKVFADLLDETIYEYIDRVKLTLIKIDGDWEISIYELLASEEATQ